MHRGRGGIDGKEAEAFVNYCLYEQSCLGHCHRYRQRGPDYHCTASSLHISNSEHLANEVRVALPLTALSYLTLDGPYTDTKEAVHSL